MYLGPFNPPLFSLYLTIQKSTTHNLPSAFTESLTQPRADYSWLRAEYEYEYVYGYSRRKAEYDMQRYQL